MYNVENNHILSGTFTFKCNTRITGDIPADESVTAYVEVDMSGVSLDDAIRIDPVVKWQNSGVKATKGHFRSHEHFADWAAENATEDNPHKVHWSNLGKQGQFKTKKETAAEMLRVMKANGVDVTNPQEVANWLLNQ